ncbi:MAG: hypothetical protein H0W83_01955 [Planctomycetes bacterium]|nr:hypothetical protein [Planctomycetota bacterium]
MSSIIPAAFLVVAVLFAGAPSSGAESALPALVSATAFELHGKLDGQPFWARLLAPDRKFNNHRVLQLVYAPPVAETLSGARLSDCPFVLLDDNARIIAWNGRESLSQVQPASPSGYTVARELLEGNGEAASVASDKRTIHGERAWDLRLAPLLLALTWSPKASADLAVVDLFGPRWKEGLRATVNGAEATIGGDGYTILADDHGRLARLVDAHGMARIEIEGWSDPAP